MQVESLTLMRSKYYANADNNGHGAVWLFWKHPKIERGAKTTQLLFHGQHERRVSRQRIGLSFLCSRFPV